MFHELRRTGVFSLQAAPASNPGRCGSESTREYSYKISIRVPSEQLDKDDFVLDHNLVQKYFTDTYSKEPWVLSCEMIAARSVVHFYNLFEDRDVKRIEVDIIAVNVSHVAIWDYNDDDGDAPEIPRVKSAFANIGQNWAQAA